MMKRNSHLKIDTIHFLLFAMLLPLIFLTVYLDVKMNFLSMLFALGRDKNFSCFSNKNLSSGISSDWDFIHQKLLSTLAKLYLYKVEPQVDAFQLM